MKIAIIGAGWVGCHLAYKLKDKYYIDLYESEEIFAGSSFKNQNRLHLGFHYARNSKTRNMCQRTFQKFIDEYSEIISDVPNNIYSIPNNGSTMDLETYLSIFQGWDYENVDIESLSEIEGSIKVNEKHIDPKKSKAFFEEKLKDIIIYKKIDNNNMNKMTKDYDFVINCTNNFFNPIDMDVDYQSTILYIYEKIKDTDFDALTLVDGDLFSIYPYVDNKYLVSHVKYSVQKNIKEEERIRLIEEDIIKHFPNFKNCFVLKDRNESFKSKVKNTTDPRVPVIEVKDNIINIFTGKIQGIFDIEDFVIQKVMQKEEETKKERIFDLFDKYLERNPFEDELASYSQISIKELENILISCDERAAMLESPRVALLISGHPRSMDILKDINNKDFYLGKNIDIFIFAWDQWGHRGTETNLDNASIKKELEDIFKSNKKIKKYKIENNKNYIKNNPTDSEISYFRFSRVEEIYIKSQLYAINQSYRLMEEYAKEFDKKYDIVIKTRFDMGINKFNITKELAEEVNSHPIIFVPDGSITGHGHPDASYCTRCEKIYESGSKIKHIFDHLNPICDTYAYGSLESMKKYCSLIDFYDEYSKKFEEWNKKVIKEIKTEYHEDGKSIWLKETSKNDELSYLFYFCSYPERHLMHHLEDYMLPKSREVILIFMKG